MSSSKNMLEEMEEDTSFEITVTRASKDETTNGNAPSHNDDETFDSAVEDKEIKVRKRTKEEKEEVKKAKKAEKKKAEADTYVEDEDLDEWPDDWEDDDE